MKPYSEEFKKTVVQKFLSRGNRSVGLICRETGVSSHAIYKWVRERGIGDGMNRNQKSPNDKSVSEKFSAVMKYDQMEESERGAFLRQEGLHTFHLDQWREQMQKGLEGSKGDVSGKRELAELTRENSELKKELNRKNAALAETTALLVLKKKADLIWGSGEVE